MTSSLSHRSPSSSSPNNHVTPTPPIPSSSSSPSASSSSSIRLVLLFVFIDILGFSITLPLLPYFSVDRFGASPATTGWVMASNALAQLVGAPFLGRLSDRVGRRPVFLLCIFGTLISFLLLTWARTLTEVVLSRVLDGLLGGNISLAQAYIADRTKTSEERAKGLGLVGAAFGIGFIVGPALGGTLAGWGYAAPCLAASFLALVNFIGAYLFLEESLPSKQQSTTESKKKKDFTTTQHPSFKDLIMSPLAPLNLLRKMFFHSEQLRLLLILRFCHSFVFTLYETTSSHFNMTRFELTARQSSYLLCYVGLLYSLLQGGAMGKLLRRFGGERPLLLSSLFVLTLSLVAYALVRDFSLLLLVLVPFSLSTACLQTLINSCITRTVEASSSIGIVFFSFCFFFLYRRLSSFVFLFLFCLY
ncbi:Tetracycline resistance MFS efflux pump [Balamuthia mandrillaris]